MDINAFDSIRFNVTKPSPLLYISVVLGFLAMLGFILEIVFIFRASLAAKDGELFKYPLNINFLK